jgi:hypothetical protein
MIQMTVNQMLSNFRWLSEISSGFDLGMSGITNRRPTQKPTHSGFSPFCRTVETSTGRYFQGFGQGKWSRQGDLNP